MEDEFVCTEIVSFRKFKIHFKIRVASIQVTIISLINLLISLFKTRCATSIIEISNSVTRSGKCVSLYVKCHPVWPSTLLKTPRIILWMFTLVERRAPHSVHSYGRVHRKSTGLDPAVHSLWCHAKSHWPAQLTYNELLYRLHIRQYLVCTTCYIEVMLQCLFLNLHNYNYCLLLNTREIQFCFFFREIFFEPLVKGLFYLNYIKHWQPLHLILYSPVFSTNSL